jgi:hypothetical protein
MNKKVIISSRQARVLFKLQKGFIIEGLVPFGYEFVLVRGSCRDSSISVSDSIVVGLQMWGIIQTSDPSDKKNYYRIWSITPKGMSLNLEDIEISDNLIREGSYVLYDKGKWCYIFEVIGFSDREKLFLGDCGPAPRSSCELVICPSCHKSVYIRIGDHTLCRDCFQKEYECDYGD